MKRLAAIVILCLIRNLCLLAQNAGDEGAGMIKELFRSYREGNTQIMVWWLPEQFWIEVGKEQAKKGGALGQAEQFTKLFRDHLIVAASEGEFGPVGGATWRNEEELRERIQVFDRNNVGYGPVPVNKLKPDIKNLFAIMKPMMANMMGAMGENLHWFVFSSTSSDGLRIADAATQGSFSVKVGDKLITWDLPLETLEPRKICSICSQNFRGRYKFCPYDGTVLSNAKPSIESLNSPQHAKQSSGERPPADFVAVEKEPVVVKRVAPSYPELALKAGLEGKVLVKIWVDKKGKPRQVEILKSDAEIFNDPSLEAAKQLLFEPAYFNGGPLDVWVTVPFNFHLIDKPKE